MSANPHANGGLLLRDCGCRTSATTRSRCPAPAPVEAEATAGLGTFLRDVMKLNLDSKNFRSSAPTRTTRTAGRTCFEVTDRCYMAEIYPEDDTSRPTAA
jgi:xylulose-5-phosphate/fructose-6-phosphate phosphoketolase